MISVHYKGTRKPRQFGNNRTVYHYPQSNYTPPPTTLPPPTPPRLVMGMSNSTLSNAARASNCGLTLDEYERRDRVVRAASNECSFQVGDTVFSPYPNIHDTHGGFLIIGVARTYEDLKNSKWPEDNRPRILTLRSLKTQKTVIAVSEEFQRLNPHPL